MTLTSPQTLAMAARMVVVVPHHMEEVAMVEGAMAEEVAMEEVVMEEAEVDSEVAAEDAGTLTA